MNKFKIADGRKFTQNQLVRSITDNIDGMQTRFAFLLGAGASRSSGIGTAAELAKKWLRELKEDSPAKYLELALDDSNDNEIAQAYSEVYKARFSLNPDDGLRELESIMDSDNVSPSSGYIMLSSLILNTSNNLVLTVNFDRLLETALLQVLHRAIRVVNHESDISLINLANRSPIIFKIHNDIFFQPISTTDELSVLSEAWERIISEILCNYHLIVLGYGGNDKEGLMKYIVRIANPDRIYWCYRQENDIPKLVIEQGYSCVKIDSFDDFMQATLEKIHKTSNTIDKLDSIYQLSLDRFPKSAELSGSYAWFLHMKYGKYDQAEVYYKKALESEPHHAENHDAYATFLSHVRQDLNLAKYHYKKATDLQPDNADFNGNYAGLLLALGEKQEALQYLNKATELQGTTRLGLELCFYRIAHFPDSYKESKYKLEYLLGENVRSVGWSFSANISHAAKDGCKYIDELCELAKKITTAPE